jgi:hypothetical protein|tara:strand:+ start:637 stop:1020 length:384 start_codon:yes stop_codon:yes gene_type:complete
MEEYNDPLDGYEEKDEFEQLEIENHILATAFRNSYQIVTGKQSFEDLLGENGSILVAHNLDDGPATSELDSIMLFFEDEEEYEKCVEIRDLITLKNDNVNREQNENTAEGICKILDNIISRTERGKE